MEPIDYNFWVKLQGHKIKVFLINDFCYRGKLLAVCNNFFEIDDIKGRKILRIENVRDVEVLS